MAAARVWRGSVTGGALAVLGAGGVCAAIGAVPALAGGIGPAGAATLLGLAGALLVAGAGLVPTAILLHHRAGGVRSVERLVWFGGWPQAVLAALLAEGALAAIFGAFLNPIGGADAVFPGVTPVLVGGTVAALGFPLLVFERHLAGANPAFPEAAALARFLRLVLLALAGGGLALVAAGAGGIPGALWLIRGIGALVGIIALETLGRALARLFLPPARAPDVRALTDGTVAALVLDRWREGGSGGLGATLVDRFGIDLSRSWALGFIRRALAPLGLGLAVLAWGVTALTALAPDQRGVYQRLGAPVAVFGPGLSLHLPWPFGIVRPTEFGTVHEMAVALPSGSSPGVAVAAEGAAAEGTAANGAADGPAPADADRLWIEAHPSDISYLVPGAETLVPGADSGQGAFELVDLDLRLIYRIGMTDRAALAAQTAVSDPEALIRAAAGAWLVRYFSTRTLAGLLREDTSRLQQEMKTALQHTLDEAGSGLELLGVVIDALHPPPGAAAAYHGVQAAEIRAAAELAKERRGAVTLTGEAREKATMTLNRAATAAQEMRASAAIDRIRFLANLQAQHEAGQGATLERRLTTLERGLAEATLTIIDRRIPLRGETTLDLRSFTSPPLPASDAPDAGIPPSTAPPDGQTPEAGTPDNGATPENDAPETPSPAKPGEAP